MAILVATVAVELGLFFVSRAAGVGLREAAAAMLMAGAVWIALTAPVLAASAPNLLRSLVRAGLTADATLLSLLIMWACWNYSSSAQERMSLISVFEVYCTCVALAVGGAFAVRGPVSQRGRLSVAVVVSALMFLGLASAFWSSGLIAATKGQTQLDVVALAVWLNPLYSITSAMVDPLHYVIQQEAVMYQITFIGDYAPAPLCPWYAATAIYLPLGVVLMAAGRFVSRRAKLRS